MSQNLSRVLLGRLGWFWPITETLLLQLSSDWPKPTQVAQHPVCQIYINNNNNLYIKRSKYRFSVLQRGVLYHGRAVIVDHRRLVGWVWAEDDAHVAQVDPNGAQVRPGKGRARKHEDFGETGERLPLFLDILYVTQQDDRLELVVVEVGGTQGHDEVA